MARASGVPTRPAGAPRRRNSSLRSFLSDPRWGQVRLRYWDELHDQKDAQGRLGVLQVASHQERESPPPPLWLSWHGPTCEPETIWRAYERRWSIEPSLHYRKAALAWTRPHLQSAEAQR
jgi:hypothetical protein